jgi:hypothetical protein
MNTSIITSALALALSAACAGFAQAPSRPCGPTATEIFHLRSECSAMGATLRKEFDFGDNHPSETSHYDPQANRCYVLIAEHWGRGTSRGDLGHEVTLYDAQSGDTLAHLTTYYHPKAGSSSVDEEISGFAGDQSLVSADTHYRGDYRSQKKFQYYVDRYMKEEKGPDSKASEREAK